MRIGAAKYDILDFHRVELGRLAQNVLNAMSGQVVRPRHVERAAKRFGQRCPRTGDNDGFSHDQIPLERYRMGRNSVSTSSRQSTRKSASSFDKHIGGLIRNTFP